VALAVLVLLAGEKYSGCEAGAVALAFPWYAFAKAGSLMCALLLTNLLILGGSVLSSWE